MALKGVEYAHSKEKQRLSKAIAWLLRPAAYGLERAVRRAIARTWGESIPPVYEERRVGANGETFMVRKFTVAHPETGECLGTWALKMERMGVDEIAQYANIREGDMHAVGRRPLNEKDHEELMDRGSPRLVAEWRHIVLPTLPGLFSTFGIEVHGGTQSAVELPDQRLEGDIKDVMKGTLVYDLGILARLGGVAVQRRLT